MIKREKIFPGGGIESGESHYEALIREVKEETGLTVISDSIKEYGLVHRVQKGDIEDMFVQDNYYYLCEVEDTHEAQKLDDYEAFEEFTLEWVTPQHAIDVNRTCEHGSADKVMVEREARVLEMLIQESGNNYANNKEMIWYEA